MTPTKDATIRTETRVTYLKIVSIDEKSSKRVDISK